MNLADKIALANQLAFYLDGRGVPLSDELADRGHADLEADDDFRRVLSERAFLCPECETWTALGENEFGCRECDDGGDDDFDW